MIGQRASTLTDVDVLQDPFDSIRDLAMRVHATLKSPPRDQHLIAAAWQYFAVHGEAPEAAELSAHAHRCADRGVCVAVERDGKTVRPVERILDVSLRSASGADAVVDLELTRTKPPGRQANWIALEPASNKHLMRGRSRPSVTRWICENYGGTWSVELDDADTDAVTRRWAPLSQT